MKIDLGDEMNNYIKELKDTKYPSAKIKNRDDKSVKQAKLSFEDVKIDDELIYGTTYELSEKLEDKFRQLDWDWMNFAEWLIKAKIERRK